ncbi:hypothetical protein AUQ09_03075 [Escherichia coli]|nr:hypothetical protein CYQ10_21775 [Escherichia coli]KXQ61924.1 hypothetical protein AUQ09_03075 [Escherichia coli]HAJ3706032.1 hypothetical protein [Escherichia coli]
MQNLSSKADHLLLTSNESSPGTALKHCRNKNNKTLIITDVRKISRNKKNEIKMRLIIMYVVKKTLWWLSVKWYYFS